MAAILVAKLVKERLFTVLSKIIVFPWVIVPIIGLPLALDKLSAFNILEGIGMIWQGSGITGPGSSDESEQSILHGIGGGIIGPHIGFKQSCCLHLPYIFLAIKHSS